MRKIIEHIFRWGFTLGTANEVPVNRFREELNKAEDQALAQIREELLEKIEKLNIEDILGQLWEDCNNIPDDEMIYDPIGTLMEKAKDRIKSQVKQVVEGMCK